MNVWFKIAILLEYLPIQLTFHRHTLTVPFPLGISKISNDLSENSFGKFVR
ncbi:hypothetical protein VSVS12_02117 [Vibrio scophthalmi]|nr:hypothetical protein VSVS12_02117 [Vibrio scophthalmi]